MFVKCPRNARCLEVVGIVQALILYSWPVAKFKNIRGEIKLISSRGEGVTFEQVIGANLMKL